MLTDKQKELRRTGIGASDARQIVSGAWRQLYDLKTDAAVQAQFEAQMLDALPVQIGNATEDLHRRWFTKATKAAVEFPDETFQHPDMPWLMATPDGLVDVGRGPTLLEMKHVNAFATLEDEVVKYMPQVQHGMAVINVQLCALSFFKGTQEHKWFLIQRDDDFLERYLEQCRKFMWHLETGTPPGDIAELDTPQAKIVDLSNMRVVDMAESNAWASHAADYIANEPAAKVFEKAKKELKELVEPDVREAKGHGVIATRDKRGLSFKIYSTPAQVVTPKRAGAQR